MEKIRYHLPGTWWRRLLYEKLDYLLSDLDETLAYCEIFKYGRRIKIGAGELFPGFYNNECLLDNLENSVRNKGEITVLFGPALYVESDKFLKFAMKYENVRLFKRARREDSHVKLVEDAEGNRFALVDEPHGLNVDKRKSVLLTNDDWEVIEIFEREYDERLQASEPLDKYRIVEKFAVERGVNKEGQLCGFISRVSGVAAVASDEAIEKLRQTLSEG